MSFDQWKLLQPEMKLDTYKVLFEGGSEGIASLTSKGWVLVEESIFRPKDAQIMAYKQLEKVGKWIKK